MAKSNPRLHPDAAAVIAAEERVDAAIAAINAGIGLGQDEALRQEHAAACRALTSAQTKRDSSLPVLSAPSLDYCEPTDLDAYAEQIQALRMQALIDSDGGRDPFADEHLLLALDFLSQAMRHVRLASLHQARGLASR